jgi:hypothetical protein
MPLFTIANTMVLSVFDGSTTTAAAVPYSHTSTSTQSQNQHQNRYYNEYHKGILEIAKTFLNILLNQLVDKTMDAAVQENESVSGFSQKSDQNVHIHKHCRTLI